MNDFQKSHSRSVAELGMKPSSLDHVASVKLDLELLINKTLDELKHFYNVNIYFP